MSQGLEALRNIDFNWVRSLESIWIDGEDHVQGPNEALSDKVVSDFFREARIADRHANGQTFVGPAGIGKTHLVASLRRKVWSSQGWFVLLDVLGLTDFWRSAALSFLTSLLQEMPDGRRQFEAVLAGVARRFKVEQQVEEAFNTPNIEVRKIVDLLIKGLMQVDMQSALQHRDIFRALCLLRSSDLNMVGLGHSWLQGYDADEDARAGQGFQAAPPAPVELVRGMSWLMSLAGPTLVAVDQIDGVVNPSSMALQANEEIGSVQGLGDLLAAGLVQLHDVRFRGKTIIACLFDSWRVLKERGGEAFWQRFDEPIAMEGMNEVSAVRALIVNRLNPAYRSARFVAPFPSWPFSDTAIANAASVGMLPRTILMRCEAFRRACIEKGSVEICNSLVFERSETGTTIVPPDRFETDSSRLRGAADISKLITPRDDSELGRLLRDSFDLFARQFEPSESMDIVSKGDPAQKIPPLHGRLTFTYHEENDRERHFCFRALEHTNAIAFQARLRAALTASGISNQMPDRHLLLIRRTPIPSGPKTKQLFAAFKNAGGVLIDPLDDDLRTFLAMRSMREEALEEGRLNDFEGWLRKRQPLLDTTFFKQARLSPPPISLSHSPVAASGDLYDSVHAPRQEPEQIENAREITNAQQIGTVTDAHFAGKPPNADTIPVGRRMTLGEEPVSLPTKLLPRHTAIIAGSGSGKTVLLRRLVEEAALAGIPSIVIDPNNDLSRLGDPWPARPGSFTVEDDAKAQIYRQLVEVVIWTPGVHGGNPLFLPVLPDFTGLGDDKDERQQAVEMAAETLGPLAGAKSALQRGVLVEALRHFASHGGGDLTSFTSLLGDLPEGLSPIGKADKLAAGMADQLHAAVATNPLLRAEGPILDPKLLFFSPKPGRVRISVINLSGLSSDTAREDFVNRLQMTLFSWIKKNPSRTGLLYVMDEAQTFLPSQKPALSLGSGTKLVAQARKYGLGMIVATQAPRGIHNQVVSNCTTQFFGKQNAPATIGAAQEIIAASGGKADDLGKLKAGEFYFATEGSGKPSKVRTSICLSYHPPNPPTPDEVIKRAKQGPRGEGR
jgi:hypothetical protein